MIIFYLEAPGYIEQVAVFVLLVKSHFDLVLLLSVSELLFGSLDLGVGFHVLLLVLLSDLFDFLLHALSLFGDLVLLHLHQV